MALGRDNEAIGCFEKAIELRPDSVQAHICQGGSFTMFGRHEDAVECFEKAIELEPNSVEAHRNKKLSLAALRLHDQ